MKILVTGGSGMVGKFLKRRLPNAIYLSSNDCDLTKYDEVFCVWKTYKPDVVIHLAARVGGILDNINYPAEYLEQNVLMNTNVLSISRKFNVARFIGLLSTCIYPDWVEEYPMTEEMLHNGAPTTTNFHYAYAKRLMAVHIDAYNKQYGLNYQYLTPCNLYGEYDKYGENSHFVAALIKKIILAKKNGEDSITLFGTGKPLRQFMYTDDLARIIELCIKNEITECFNVATTENYTINEIANIAIQSIGDNKIKNILYDSSKPDGQFRKDVSIKKLINLVPNFQATPLVVGIKKTHDYLIKNNII